MEAPFSQIQKKLSQYFIFASLSIMFGKEFKKGKKSYAIFQTNASYVKQLRDLLLGNDRCVLSEDNYT